MNRMDINMPWLASFLMDVARITDVATALKLAEAWGGTDRYIPRQPAQDSPLAHIVGIDAARKIGAAFGGENFDIPLLRSPSKKELILAAEGGTREVAVSVGSSERYVRKVRECAGLKKTHLQETILATEGSASDVAAVLGCSEDWVRETRKRAGITSPPPPSPKHRF